MTEQNEPKTSTPSHEAYDVLADDENNQRKGWDSPWGDNPLQRYYSWPATRSLLPDISDKRVLDAGCGIGDHIPWLLNEGGTVVGIDGSEQAIEIAQQQYGDVATFHHVDLTQPLDFTTDNAFEVILSHLVLDHIQDWQVVFEEFNRILTEDGTLVFTVIHPMQYYLDYDEVPCYYERASVELSWPDASVTSYHRPTSQMLNPLTTAGFRLETVEEPQPSDEYLQHAHDRWNVDERPQIFCIRAQPRATR